MDFFFADDSCQENPSRRGVGKLVARGGVHVPDLAVSTLEKEINDLCASTGFPAGEPFKWSPGRELWMRDHLTGSQRQAFFLNLLLQMKRRGVTAIVVVEDTHHNPAITGVSAELDVTSLFLERADRHLVKVESEGIVIVDRPGGDARTQDTFLLDCQEVLQSGTKYVSIQKLALNVLSANSRFVRLLQAADVVTSCTCAFVSGEDVHSPRVFAHIKRIFDKDDGMIGGFGLKIHPDFRYANLYHWLLGDCTYRHYSSEQPLPIKERPYASSPDTP